MKKILMLFLVVFSLSFSFELKKENFKITKNKSLKLSEEEMKNQSEKVVEVFNKEISDRIESKNKGIEYSENTNLETGEKNFKVNVPDVLMNNKVYEKTIYKIEKINFISKNKVEVIYTEKSPNIFEIIFSEEFNKKLEDKVSKELGYKLDNEKIQKLSNEERLKANAIILSEYQNEMIKILDNNQFEYMTNKNKMILERKKKGWEYKDEETLESDGFDIFDSMFEILENNLNKWGWGMRMKKMLMLFLLTASLGFSANYKVEVKPNVKIQQSEIEKNNLEIEKVFLENTKRDTLEGIKEVDNQIAEQKDELGARFFGEILKEYMRNMEYRIKEINYNSSSSADLKFVLKAPKLNFNSLLGDEDQEKINKTFEQKTGKSIKYLSNVSGEDFQKKWMPTLIDIISKTVSDKIKDIKEFDEKEGTVEATKINGKWNIIMNNLK